MILSINRRKLIKEKNQIVGGIKKVFKATFSFLGLFVFRPKLILLVDKHELLISESYNHYIKEILLKKILFEAYKIILIYIFRK